LTRRCQAVNKCYAKCHDFIHLCPRIITFSTLKVLKCIYYIPVLWIWKELRVSYNIHDFSWTNLGKVWKLPRWPELRLRFDPDY
jgi:hypothetical protein